MIINMDFSDNNPKFITNASDYDKQSKTNEIVISVILMAYNRKKYIHMALQSLLEQTLDKRKFEVICITNFEFELSQEYESMNVQKVIMDGKIGEFIKSGITVSNGELISILEDDDLFSPDKLLSIYNLYAKTKFAYLKNEMRKIDKNGEPLDKSINIENGDSNSVTVLQLRDGTFKEIQNMIKLRSFPSTITFRKVLILPHLESMMNVESEISVFIFYNLLQFENIFIWNKSPLTLYRISEESDSHSVLFTTHIETRKRYLVRTLKTYQLLLDTVDKSNKYAVILFEFSFYKLELLYLNERRPSVNLLTFSLKFIYISNSKHVFLLKLAYEIFSFIFGPIFYISVRKLFHLRSLNSL